MATTIEKKVAPKWTSMIQDPKPGWYDIILLTGEQYIEVYFEHGYFHFTNSNSSIQSTRVEWIRTHSKR
jgi:hypothetical protein